MNNEQMDKIIEAVLERIEKNQTPKDRILVLYADCRSEVRESIRQIRILVERGYELTHIYTPGMLRCMMYWKQAGTIDWYPEPSYTEEDEFQSMKILEQTDLILLPTWSVGFLTQLQEGYEENLVQILLQEVLCREMPLLASEGSAAKYRESEYYQMHLAKRTDCLKKYGAKMLPIQELSGYVLSGAYQTGAGLEEKRNDIFTDTIFCSEDLKKAKENKILVGERTIISQEAMDQAKERGIQIIKERKKHV